MGLASEINGRTALYGLIGNPIGHTFSPMIHNTLAELTGQNLVYCPLPVQDADRLGEAIRGAYALGIQGMNVTVPYKSAVLPFLVEVDPIAKAIGAVNTLVRVEGGYKGYNTDYLGLWRALEEHGIVFPRPLREVMGSSGKAAVPEEDRQTDEREKSEEGQQAAGETRKKTGSQIKVHQVVILGAGGAARAAGFLCGQAGIRDVTILNRTIEKAQALAEDIRKEFPQMRVAALALRDAGRVAYEQFLAIQCTKVGLYPDINDVPTTSATFYRRVQAAYDCIYNPEETKFLSEVHKRRKPGWSGLDMLLWQGIAAYEYWTGAKVDEPQSREVREALVDFLRERRRKKSFVLVGFMGSGKTTVGEALAKTLGWQQVDTDALIEQTQKKAISQIFRENGEEGFRQMETALLQEMADRPEAADGTGQIISTGGGIVLRQENRQLLHQLGTVVLLNVQAPTVVARVGRDSARPLLQGKDRLRRVSTLLARRQPAYHDTADLVVDTDGKTPDEIAAEILRRTR